MTSKPKSKKNDPDQITMRSKSDEDDALVIARTALRPTVQAAVTLKAYDRSLGDLSLDGLISALSEQTNASNKGDLGRSEAMLTTQAHTLDAIFNNLAKRAIDSEYMENLDSYLKLALRAQSQCRATLEALSTLKNPPVMGYVRQANIANGPQQVNNSATDDSRARENSNSENELLEKKDGERLDIKTACPTSKVDSAMATVGEIDGTEDQDR